MLYKLLEKQTKFLPVIEVYVGLIKQYWLNIALTLQILNHIQEYWCQGLAVVVEDFQKQYLCARLNEKKRTSYLAVITPNTFYANTAYCGFVHFLYIYWKTK